MISNDKLVKRLISLSIIHLCKPDLSEAIVWKLDEISFIVDCISTVLSSVSTTFVCEQFGTSLQTIENAEIINAVLRETLPFVLSLTYQRRLAGLSLISPILSVRSSLSSSFIYESIPLSMYFFICSLLTPSFSTGTNIPSQDESFDNIDMAIQLGDRHLSRFVIAAFGKRSFSSSHFLDHHIPRKGGESSLVNLKWPLSVDYSVSDFANIFCKIASLGSLWAAVLCPSVLSNCTLFVNTNVYSKPHSVVTIMTTWHNVLRKGANLLRSIKKHGDSSPAPISSVTSARLSHSIFSIFSTCSSIIQRECSTLKLSFSTLHVVPKSIDSSTTAAVLVETVKLISILFEFLSRSQISAVCKLLIPLTISHPSNRVRKQCVIALRRINTFATLHKLDDLVTLLPSVLLLCVGDECVDVSNELHIKSASVSATKDIRRVSMCLDRDRIKKKLGISSHALVDPTIDSSIRQYFTQLGLLKPVSGQPSPKTISRKSLPQDEESPTLLVSGSSSLYGNNSLFHVWRMALSPSLSSLIYSLDTYSNPQDTSAMLTALCCSGCILQRDLTEILVKTMLQSITTARKGHQKRKKGSSSLATPTNPQKISPACSMFVFSRFLLLGESAITTVVCKRILPHVITNTAAADSNLMLSSCFTFLIILFQSCPKLVAPFASSIQRACRSSITNISDTKITLLARWTSKSKKGSSSLATPTNPQKISPACSMFVFSRFLLLGESAITTVVCKRILPHVITNTAAADSNLMLSSCFTFLIILFQSCPKLVAPFASSIQRACRSSITNISDTKITLLARCVSALCSGVSEEKKGSSSLATPTNPQKISPACSMFVFSRFLLLGESAITTVVCKRILPHVITNTAAADSNLMLSSCFTFLIILFQSCPKLVAPFASSIQRACRSSITNISDTKITLLARCVSALCSGVSEESLNNTLRDIKELGKQIVGHQKSIDPEIAKLSKKKATNLLKETCSVLPFIPMSFPNPHDLSYTLKTLILQMSSLPTIASAAIESLVSIGKRVHGNRIEDEQVRSVCWLGVGMLCVASKDMRSSLLSNIESLASDNNNSSSQASMQSYFIPNVDMDEGINSGTPFPEFILNRHRTVHACSIGELSAMSIPPFLQKILLVKPAVSAHETTLLSLRTLSASLFPYPTTADGVIACVSQLLELAKSREGAGAPSEMGQSLMESESELSLPDSERSSRTDSKRGKGAISTDREQLGGDGSIPSLLQGMGGAVEMMLRKYITRSSGSWEGERFKMSVEGGWKDFASSFLSNKDDDIAGMDSRIGPDSGLFSLSLFSCESSLPSLSFSQASIVSLTILSTLTDVSIAHKLCIQSLSLSLCSEDPRMLMVGEMCVDLLLKLEQHSILNSLLSSLIDLPSTPSAIKAMRDIVVQLKKHNTISDKDIREICRKSANIIETGSTIQQKAVACSLLVDTTLKSTFSDSVRVLVAVVRDDKEEDDERFRAVAAKELSRLLDEFSGSIGNQVISELHTLINHARIHDIKRSLRLLRTFSVLLNPQDFYNFCAMFMLDKNQEVRKVAAHIFEEKKEEIERNQLEKRRSSSLEGEEDEDEALMSVVDTSTPPVVSLPLSCPYPTSNTDDSPSQVVGTTISLRNDSDIFIVSPALNSVLSLLSHSQLVDLSTIVKICTSEIINGLSSPENCIRSGVKGLKEVFNSIHVVKVAYMSGQSEVNPSFVGKVCSLIEMTQRTARQIRASLHSLLMNRTSTRNIVQSVDMNAVSFLHMLNHCTCALVSLLSAVSVRIEDPRECEEYVVSTLTALLLGVSERVVSRYAAECLICWLIHEMQLFEVRKASGISSSLGSIYSTQLRRCLMALLGRVYIFGAKRVDVIIVCIVALCISEYIGTGSDSEDFVSLAGETSGIFLEILTGPLKGESRTFLLSIFNDFPMLRTWKGVKGRNLESIIEE
ncbi:hypothetical protein ADUPG1_012870 [Aduncisulcus paluster]|uniref:ARM repeat superfamily protein n=1 Tax=Aduncisulcus paluster TaxID=2918883 RepID=A0ABQ5K0Y7_9EUKA|nr:hypothetical protein ADUPG1_012870 [Aduncisulcus paluster]